MEQQMIEVVNELAKNLGVAVDKLWGWALLQVKVEIYRGFITLAMAVIFVFIEFKLVKKVIKCYEECDDYITIPWFILAVLIGILTLILSIESILFLYKLPQYLINQEFSAFQILLEEISSLK